MALAVLLAAAPASADVALAEQARVHLKRAESLLRDGDYRNALWNFQQANIQRPTPDAALGAAECYEKLGDKAYAAYYYRVYLRRAPNARDSLEVAERVGEVLYAEMTNGRALLEVESPVPAKGTIEGKVYNAFPIALFLPPGDHELTVEFANGPQSRTVSVRRGRATTSLALEPPGEPPIAVAALARSMPLAGKSSPAPADKPEWAVIAHAGAFASMSQERLREIFSGERIVSENGQIAQIVLAREGSPSRAAFLARFLRRTEASFSASWRKLVFRGAGVRAPVEVISDEDVVRTVASRPGAVGIVAADIETSGVTRVTVH